MHAFSVRAPLVARVCPGVSFATHELPAARDRLQYNVRLQKRLKCSYLSARVWYSSRGRALKHSTWAHGGQDLSTGMRTCLVCFSGAQCERAAEVEECWHTQQVLLHVTRVRDAQ